MNYRKVDVNNFDALWDWVKSFGFTGAFYTLQGEIYPRRIYLTSTTAMISGIVDGDYMVADGQEIHVFKGKFFEDHILPHIPAGFVGINLPDNNKLNKG